MLITEPKYTLQVTTERNTETGKMLKDNVLKHMFEEGTDRKSCNRSQWKNELRWDDHRKYKNILNITPL